MTLIPGPSEKQRTNNRENMVFLRFLLGLFGLIALTLAEYQADVSKLTVKLVSCTKENVGPI
jgi:hypothetical protein